MTYKRRKKHSVAAIIELKCSYVIPNKRTRHIMSHTQFLIFRYSYEFRQIILLSSASRIRMFHPDSACKLSANLYDIYHCCVYSEKHLMMDRGTVRNM